MAESDSESASNATAGPWSEASGDVDPQVVLELAVLLVRAHPETAPVAAAAVAAYVEFFRNLAEDCDLLDRFRQQKESERWTTN